MAEPSSDLPLILKEGFQQNTEGPLFYYVVNISMALVILAMILVFGSNAVGNGALNYAILPASSAMVASAVVTGIAGFDARHKIPGLSSL